MKLRTLGATVVFSLFALTMAGCDAVEDPVAPNSDVAAERADDARSSSDRDDGRPQGDPDEGPPWSNGDDDAATVYVVHGINGTDLGPDIPESLPVDVAVDGTCVLEDFTFRSIEGPLSLEPGEYDLAVYLADGDACSGDLAVSAEDVPLAAGDNVSVTAHLNTDGEPTLTPFVNDVSARPGKTRVSARHAANFGAVDVVVDGAKPYTGLENGQQFGAFLRPGHHTVALTPTGENARVFELTTAFRPFVLYAAYAVGTPDNDTFEVLLQTIEVGPKANRDEDDEDDQG